MAANGERAKLVSKPLDFPPYTCVVTGRSDGELIDFGADFVGVDPHIYIQRHTVEAVAEKTIGLVPKTKLREAERTIRRQEQELAELRAYRKASQDLAEAAAQLEVVGA